MRTTSVPHLHAPSRGELVTIAAILVVIVLGGYALMGIAAGAF